MHENQKRSFGSRSIKDRRRAYDLDYFEEGGVERRSYIERRRKKGARKASEQEMNPNRDMIDEKTTWLAHKIFTSFPGHVGAIKSYILACECIYFQRVLPNGNLDPMRGFYREADHGPCEECMRFPDDWKERVIDEAVIYSCKLRMVQ
jgi:hypothetical protein